MGKTPCPLSHKKPGVIPLWCAGPSPFCSSDFNHSTFLFLGFADLILSLMDAIVLLTPPVVPSPKYLATGFTEVETPMDESCLAKANPCLRLVLRITFFFDTLACVPLGSN